MLTSRHWRQDMKYSPLHSLLFHWLYNEILNKFKIFLSGSYSAFAFQKYIICHKSLILHWMFFLDSFGFQACDWMDLLFPGMWLDGFVVSRHVIGWIYCFQACDWMDLLFPGMWLDGFGASRHIVVAAIYIMNGYGDSSIEVDRDHILKIVIRVLLV